MEKKTSFPFQQLYAIIVKQWAADDDDDLVVVEIKDDLQTVVYGAIPHT